MNYTIFESKTKAIESMKKSILNWWC